MYIPNAQFRVELVIKPIHHSFSMRPRPRPLPKDIQRNSTKTNSQMYPPKNQKGPPNTDTINCIIRHQRKYKPFPRQKRTREGWGVLGGGTKNVFGEVEGGEGT